MIFMFETLAIMAATSCRRCTVCSPRRCRCAPDRSSITFRLNPKARFYNGDPVTAADVKHSLRHADEPARRPDRAHSARGHRARDRDRSRARSASTSRTRLGRRDLQARHAPAGVLAKMGQDAARQAEGVRPDRQRVPDHERPVHDRAGRFGSASRIRSQHELLGARTRCPARLLQFRSHRLPLLSGRRRQPSRRSRPASSTCCSNTRRGSGRASTRGRNGATAGSSSRSSRTASAPGCSPTSSTCAGRSSRTSAFATRWRSPTTSKRSTSISNT